MNTSSNEHLSKEQLWEYIDTTSHTLQITEHLSSCPHCSEQLEELTSIHDELKQLTQYEPSREFSQKVVSRWENSNIRFPWFVAAVITYFASIFGLSAYMFIQSAAPSNTEYVQLFSFIVIICAYWLFGIRENRKLEKSV